MLSPPLRPKAVTAVVRTILSGMNKMTDLTLLKQRALEADLPETYRWGDDAMDCFRVGKRAAWQAIEPVVSSLLADMEALKGEASRSQPGGGAAAQRSTGLDAEPSAARELDQRHWEVEVRIDGERVLTIGHEHLSGLEDIDKYGDVIRTCAEHLRSFIGSGEPEPCFACGGSGQERWMGACGEEVGPCPVCSEDPSNVELPE